MLTVTLHMQLWQVINQAICKFGHWQNVDLPSGSKEQGSPSTALLMADRLPESCKSSCMPPAAAAR